MYKNGKIYVYESRCLILVSYGEYKIFREYIIWLLVEKKMVKVTIILVIKDKGINRERY